MANFQPVEGTGRQSDGCRPDIRRRGGRIGIPPHIASRPVRILGDCGRSPTRKREAGSQGVIDPQLDKVVAGDPEMEGPRGGRREERARDLAVILVSKRVGAPLQLDANARAWVVEVALRIGCLQGTGLDPDEVRAGGRLGQKGREGGIVARGQVKPHPLRPTVASEGTEVRPLREGTGRRQLEPCGLEEVRLGDVDVILRADGESRGGARPDGGKHDLVVTQGGPVVEGNNAHGPLVRGQVKAAGAQGSAPFPIPRKVAVGTVNLPSGGVPPSDVIVGARHHQERIKDVRCVERDHESLAGPGCVEVLRQRAQVVDLRDLLTNPGSPPRKGGGNDRRGDRRTRPVKIQRLDARVHAVARVVLGHREPVVRQSNGHVLAGQANGIKQPTGCGHQRMDGGEGARQLERRGSVALDRHAVQRGAICHLRSRGGHHHQPATAARGQGRRHGGEARKVRGHAEDRAISGNKGRRVARGLRHSAHGRSGAVLEQDLVQLHPVVSTIRAPDRRENNLVELECGSTRDGGCRAEGVARRREVGVARGHGSAPCRGVPRQGHVGTVKLVRGRVAVRSVVGASKLDARQANRLRECHDDSRVAPLGRVPEPIEVEVLAIVPREEVGGTLMDARVAGPRLVVLGACRDLGDPDAGCRVGRDGVTDREEVISGALREVQLEPVILVCREIDRAGPSQA